MKRWLWIVPLALAPLAGLAGEGLWIKLASIRDIHFTVDRATAISIGRRFAESQGFSTEGMTGYATPAASETLHAYYRSVDTPLTRRLRQAVPEVQVRVVFVAPLGKRAFETLLSGDGRILGFRKILPAESFTVGIIHVSSDQSSTQAHSDETGQEAAKIAAEAGQRRIEEFNYLSFLPVEVETDRKDDALLHTFLRKASSPDLPGLEVVSKIQVAGNGVVQDTLEANVDPEYASQRLPSDTTAKAVLGILLAVVGLIAVVYTFVRYVKRTRERETSHRRNLAVGLIVSLSLSVSGVLVALDSIGIAIQRTPSEPFFLMVVAVVIASYCFAGLFFGLIWGATEGEVREAFPGKLTSLDALVVGKLFSRNVARAVMYGSAMGAWCLLLSAALQWPWSNSPLFGGDLSTMTKVFYSRVPWLTALVSPVLGIVSAASLGVLLPIAFSFRHLRSPRLRFGFVTVLAFLGCSAITLRHDPFEASVVLTVVLGAVLLSSFFLFDLLTAMVALGLHGFVLLLTQIGVSNSFSRGVVLTAAGLTLLLLAIEIVFAFTGSECLPEEVQPVYAQHQSDRRAMQAEVSAAREAQLRLLPQRPPEMEGLSVAADCRPAKVVGGDFFDFFPITENRLGIFFAEGGGGGLSAALSIAYAKGLLMPLVRDVSSPKRIVEKLHQALDPLVDDARMGILYATVDTTDGTLSCSRFGRYPKVMLCRQDGTCELPLQEDPADQRRIVEWSMQLEPKDRVIFFTDGVETALNAANQTPVDWILGFLAKHHNDHLVSVHREFMDAIDRHLKHARRQGVEDDLAAILLHLHRTVALRREEVA